MSKLGIKTYKTSPYHANSNLSERMLREVNRMLRAYSHQEHHEWSKYVEQIEETINTTMHDSTGVSPHEALFSTPPIKDIEEIVDFSWFVKPRKDMIQQIRNRLWVKAQERNRRQDKSKLCHVQYQIGDMVLLKNRQLPSGELGFMKKLFLLYVGPFRVKRINPNNTIVTEYEDGEEKGTVNINQVKPYKSLENKC